MKKSLMHKNNWLLVIGGILITYLGFVLIAPITTNYDGFYAFVAISVTIIGLIIVIVGLSVDFYSNEKKFPSFNRTKKI